MVFDFPFKVTGIDYLGPVFVSGVYDVTSMNKAWISLFTCAATRAIHLELVPDNHSETFLRVFRRFISRRGIPSKTISDNASTFTSGKVQYFITEKGVTWQFNPPASPWWGGFFERLVQLVKRCLRKILFKVRISYDEMETVLAEIECSLNNRPLTYTYNELTDEVLTPNHLIYGKRLNEQCTENIVSDNSSYSSRYNNMSKLIEHFKGRFEKEYLAELRVRHSTQRLKEGKDVVFEGDVVLIVDDKQPRSKWRLGIIQSLSLGKDNKIRTAVVRTTTTDGVSYLKRPLKLLCPIEANNC